MTPLGRASLVVALTLLSLWISGQDAEATFSVSVPKSGFYTGANCGQIGEGVDNIEIPRGSTVDAPFCLTGGVDQTEVTRGNVKLRIYDSDFGEELIPGDQLLKEVTLDLPDGTAVGSTVPLPTTIRLGCTAQGHVQGTDGGESEAEGYYWVESASPRYPYYGYALTAPIPIRCTGGKVLGVGGVAELPEVDRAPLDQRDSSGPSTAVLAGVAAGAAGAPMVLGAAWYLRRRTPPGR